LSGLSSNFPNYPESTNGPFHVSLSIPGPISEISKSIGVTSSASLILPNIDYLIKFINGNLGIADEVKKSMKLKNINLCKTEDSFKQFAKLAKLDIKNPSKYKTKNGYSIPKSLISDDPSEDMMGLKAMEKTILKSISDTQKPFLEVIKLITENLVKIEDVIARSKPLLAPGISSKGRLQVKSEKPKTNAGSGSGPKAIGFDSGSEVKNALGQLQSLGNKGKKVKIKKDGSFESTPNPVDPTSNDAKYPDTGNSGEYKVISTVYSTGEFEPDVNYKYTYIDIKDDSFGKDDLLEKSDLDLGDGDPYQKLKPKKIIFGLFNSEGNLINPMNKLKAIDGNGDEIETPFYIADWITRSPKWFFPNNINNKHGKSSWNRFGSPFYFWERYGGADIQRSQSKPSIGDNQPDYSKKQYDSGSRDGDEIVDFTGTSDMDDFISYFTDLVSKKINSSTDIEESDKPIYINQVLSKLYEKDEDGTKQVGPYTLEKKQIDNHLDNVYKYGMISSCDFTNDTSQSVQIPGGMKYPFKPGYISVGGKTVWIDPESDYDLKVIKVDSVIDITYDETQGAPEISTEILSFIKNSIVIRVVDGNTPLPFSISISRNTDSPTISENITEYQLDNWNYNDEDGLLGSKKPTINNLNQYDITIWRTSDNPYFSTRSLANFPSGSVNFQDMKRRSDNSWSYMEYTLTTSSDAILSIGTDAYDVSGSPVDNGEIVTQVKVISLAGISAVGSWYFKKSGDALPAWHNLPPDSWKSSGFGITWQFEKNDQSSNGSLPNTTTKTITYFDIEKVTILTVDYWKFKEPKVSVETRTYIQVADGEKTLGDGSIVFVKDYIVTKWIVYREVITNNTQINNKKIVPDFNRSNNISLKYETFGNYSTFDANFDISIIPEFQIRVKDNTKYGKMIDPSKITNDHLTHDDLYSSSKYGGSPQQIGVIKRYMKTELDFETYYIVEGVLIEDNGSGVSSNQTGGGGKEWYRMPNALGSTKVFLSVLADIISKLIPTIKKLLELFKNPAKFITDIISEKLGSSFTIFSPGAMSIMKQLPSIDIKKRSSFVKNSALSNYISVNTDGSYKFLLDGVGLMNFLLPIGGDMLTFGMQLEMLKPSLKLIHSIDFSQIPPNSLESFLNGGDTNKFGKLGNIDLRPDQNVVKNEVVSKSNGTTDTEEISIQYSTGKFIEGVDYRYIYLTEYVSNLIKEADDLEKTNDPANMEIAKSKLELALKSDPSNDLIKSKLEDLINKTKSYIQPILKFLIEIVSLPMKIIAGIIKWIKDLFESMSSLPSMPSKMKELLSFKWIMDFVSPNAILGLAGIKFDVGKLFGWIKNIKSFSPDHEFDLSEIIDIKLIASMSKVKKAQFIDMLKKPLRILYPTLCLIESIVNGIIDFIWSTLGIEAIIKAPHLNLCKQLNEDMSTQDIMDLLNGAFRDSGINGTDGNSASSNFIYEIVVSDGRLLRDLNQEELRNFIEENKNISFDFLFE
jgi:hypothetical protein